MRDERARQLIVRLLVAKCRALEIRRPKSSSHEAWPTVVCGQLRGALGNYKKLVEGGDDGAGD
jgi:hypothetical protein